MVSCAACAGIFNELSRLLASGESCDYGKSSYPSQTVCGMASSSAEWLAGLATIPVWAFLPVTPHEDREELKSNNNDKQTNRKKMICSEHRVVGRLACATRASKTRNTANKHTVVLRRKHHTRIHLFFFLLLHNFEKPKSFFPSRHRCDITNFHNPACLNSIINIISYHYHKHCPMEIGEVGNVRFCTHKALKPDENRKISHMRVFGCAFLACWMPVFCIYIPWPENKHITKETRTRPKVKIESQSDQKP